MSPGAIDVVNCGWELAGCCLAWMNVRRLWRDRTVAGVHWQTWIFLTAWNVWSDYFYLQLGQLWSLAACLLLTLANATWVVLAISSRTFR